MSNDSFDFIFGMTCFLQAKAASLGQQIFQPQVHGGSRCGFLAQEPIPIAYRFLCTFW